MRNANESPETHRADTKGAEFLRMPSVIPKTGLALGATDGLFRFATPARIAHQVRSAVRPRLPSLLSDLVRLPNGELQDDVAIVVCEEDADRIGLTRLIAERLAAAREGDSDACIELAQCYELLDQEEAAAHWFKLAADAGSAEACYDIGLSYAKGRGVTQDYSLANRYYWLGELRGCALAINNFGYHYECGDRGLEKSLELALHCYRRSAELGASTGQFNLAKAYQFGRFGVTPDKPRAAMLFRAAARQGDDSAMVAWGDCLEKGIGVPVNHAKAKAQYWRAMAVRSADLDSRRLNRGL